MRYVLHGFIAFLICVFTASFSFAENSENDYGTDYDETIIVPFPQKMALNISFKYNIGIFQQQLTVYRTDKPFDIGLGLRYKNIAAKIFVAVDPDAIPFHDSFDTALNFYFRNTYFETFVNRYTNFYNNDDETDVHENIGLEVFNAGFLSGWVVNNKRHSLRSVFSLSEKQIESSGSFMYGLGVFYTSLHSETTAMPHYNERKHIVYFGPTIGYSYIWIFSHDLFLNLMGNIGIDLGINIPDTRLLFIPQINPKITFGHHGDAWSINTVLGYNASVFLWDKKNIDTIAPATISVTFSGRFK
ncbi:MAG: hypothetical protein Ta2A_12550 [Treponemataceae bacterium]|nr:MAG: hypothetical protein Ta2A_12550 [Treponemataceae bacterium]